MRGPIQNQHVINAKGEGVLTPREDQVVSLVAEGIGNREIAEQLSIKENTVKKSLLRIYDKLGVSNRVELVLYALTHRDKYRSHSVPTKHPPGRATGPAAHKAANRVGGCDAVVRTTKDDLETPLPWVSA